MKKPIFTLNLGGTSGQALVELVAIIIICLLMAFGIFELGAYLHNISVLHRSTDNASLYASYGAPIERIKEVFELESANLLSTPFLYQQLDLDQLFVEIWNPYSGEKIAPLDSTDFPFDKPRLEPAIEGVASYLFWAQGYEIRVGLAYRVGIYIPFLGPLALSRPIGSTRVIQTSNDLDRDGLVDAWEPGYLLYYLDQTGDTEWIHPSHLDYTGQFDADINVDYDYNNSGIENKFDAGNNLLYQNPAVGP